MFTEPIVALIVPLALIALLQTGKPISVSVFTSRTPASIMSARAPRAMKRGGEQIAEIAVRAFGGDRRDHDVAGLYLLGCDMHHPVVAGMQKHRDGRAGHLRAGIDRPHIRLHQPDPAHRLMHGRGAIGGQRVGRGAVGALDVAVDDTQFGHRVLLQRPCAVSALSSRG